MDWDLLILFLKECMKIFIKGMLGGSIIIGGITIALYIIFSVGNWFRSLTNR